MKIIDNIDGVILTINDRMDAIREANSRVKWYKKKNIDTIYTVSSDEIYIRRK